MSLRLASLSQKHIWFALELVLGEALVLVQLGGGEHVEILTIKMQ
jgi:hypothetical protein